jgi:hypothetical protein
MSEKVSITLYDGKYTYIREGGRQSILRYGEHWRDETGDGFILAMAQEIEELRKRDAKLTALENAGVDNWEWYDEAMRELDNDQ